MRVSARILTSFYENSTTIKDGLGVAILLSVAVYVDNWSHTFSRILTKFYARSVTSVGDPT